MRDRRRKIFPQGSTGHRYCEMKNKKNRRPDRTANYDLLFSIPAAAPA